VTGTELALAGCNWAVWAKSGAGEAKGIRAAALLKSAKRMDIGETYFSCWTALSQPVGILLSVFNVRIRLFRRIR
jgi:hypothetical protein